jgi:ParB family chromosome partitioning protein
MEEAQAFERLMGLNEWNAKQLAEAIRVHPSKISRALSLLRLPEGIQQQVASGQISARSAHEISKLTDQGVQQRMAAMARAQELTHRQVARAVSQRRGKRKPAPRATKQTFMVEKGWRVVVSSSTRGTYHDIEEALVQALDEVRLRIENNVQLF